MRFRDVVDASTASSLQIAWLHAQLEPVSEAGRRASELLAPFKPGQEDLAAQRARTIDDLARRIDADRVDAMRDALRGAPDPISAIATAGMGGALNDAQLLELMRFLDAAARIDALRPEGDALPPYLDDAARAVAESLERGRAGKFGFYLSEKFDAALARARERAEQAQAEYESARGRLAQRVAGELGREEISGAEFIVMREDVRSLPRGVRVIREAPTYFLCELELDDAALDALRKRDASAEALAQGEDAVRERISAVVREHGQALEQLVRAMGDLDVALSHVRFAQAYECVAPEIVDDRTLSFHDARFLPLQFELEAEGRRYEPISVDLLGVGILTGPNMGGKSAALRTCGFVAVLAAFGIPVPASYVRASLFDEIAWLGIGAREDPGGLLSSFAREVVRLQELLARGSARMLLLIDEFARTTTPAEGQALLVALVRVLQRRKRTAFIATHLAGVEDEAGAQHFAVRGLRNVPKPAPDADLRAVLDALAQAMDYAVIPMTGAAPSHGDAIALAHLLGLDGEVIAEAGTVLGTEGASSWTR